MNAQPGMDASGSQPARSARPLRTLSLVAVLVLLSVLLGWQLTRESQPVNPAETEALIQRQRELERQLQQRVIGELHALRAQFVFEDADRLGGNGPPRIVGVHLHIARDIDAALDWILLGLPDLEELRLSHSQVGDAHLELVEDLHALRRLDIGYTSVTDQGLSHLESLSNLEELELAYTEISDSGLAVLHDHDRLRQLGLMGTKVTDAGIEHLCDLPKLRVLILTRTSVTDAALGSLARVKTLRFLNVDETHVSREAGRQLRETIPGCIVLR